MLENDRPYLERFFYASLGSWRYLPCAIRIVSMGRPNISFTPIGMLPLSHRYHSHDPWETFPSGSLALHLQRYDIWKGCLQLAAGSA